MLAVFSTMACVKHKPRLQGWILLAWLGVWTPRASAQGSGAEVTAAVGDTVTLTATVPAGAFTFTWYRGAAALYDQLILSYVLSSSAQTSGPQSTGRESGLPDGSLRIIGLRSSDTGNYTVSVILSDGSPRVSNKQLRVYAWLGVFTPLTAAQGSGAEVTAAVGDTETLTAPGPADLLLFAWYRGAAVLDTQRIFTYLLSSSAQTSGDQYTGRESGLPDGSLRITGLRSSDTGNYTVVVTQSDGSPRTSNKQLRVYGVNIPPTDSPCPAPCWQTTLGVACGVLLGAAVIMAGMAVHYERRLNRKGTNKDETACQNPNCIQNPNTQYENVKKGPMGQPANQDSAEDSAYMELKHGDRATYEQIKRP